MAPVQMFHPSANRLAGFLEISALSIFLARSCGFQTKAGYLRIKSRNKGAGFGRKSVSWVERQESRWCAVRESYLVVLEEPGEVCPTTGNALDGSAQCSATPSLPSGTCFYSTQISKSNAPSDITVNLSVSFTRNPIRGTVGTRNRILRMAMRTVCP